MGKEQVNWSAEERKDMRVEALRAAARIRQENGAGDLALSDAKRFYEFLLEE